MEYHVLKKGNDYYVGGFILWSRYSIRAIRFMDILEAEKAKSLMGTPEKITIETITDQRAI